MREWTQLTSGGLACGEIKNGASGLWDALRVWQESRVRCKRESRNAGGSLKTWTKSWAWFAGKACEQGLLVCNCFVGVFDCVILRAPCVAGSAAGRQVSGTRQQDEDAG